MMEPTHFLWSGRCREREIQERLCSRLRPLAEVFQSKFLDLPRICHYEETLKGRIVVSPALFQKRLDGIGLIDVARPEALSGDSGKGFILVDEVASFGLDFHSYTGEFENSRDDDRISLVFIRCKKHPGLEGVMARVDDRSSIHIAQARQVQDADYFLSPPRLRVQFPFNFWFKNLLLWVYQFFAPDMEMWENETPIQKKYFPETSPGRDADEAAVLERVANLYDSTVKLSALGKSREKKP